MTSSFRIPAAPMTSPAARAVGAVARRMYGRVPDMVPVMWHHTKVLRSVLAWERRVGTWDALDPHLKSFAVMASAASIGCSWCLDFGYYLAHDEGLDERKVREVPRWHESDVFSPLEREVMAYAEAMTVTPPTVTDAQVASLRESLGDAALVELTMMVAVENQRSRFNAAVGLASQGFSDVCELPLADAR
ncbi:MAG: carboxymuconolactone decarboxylase family protein [Aeromicrobium sp.]